MITAVHMLVYADDAEAARAFFRDVLELPYVDAHDGWLIFRTGPSELGVHPVADASGYVSPTGPHHEISLMCDDIARTVDELKARGAEFSSDVETRGFGLIAMLRVPGADDVMLYQPRHPIAYEL